MRVFATPHLQMNIIDYSVSQNHNINKKKIRIMLVGGKHLAMRYYSASAIVTCTVLKWSSVLQLELLCKSGGATGSP